MAQKNLNKQFGVVRVTDNTTLNVVAGVTVTLDRLDSGTHYNIDGTANVVINLPALNTLNVGVSYSFLVTTAVGGGTTTIFVLPETGGVLVSNFYAERVKYATASYPRLATSGDTLTLNNASAIGSRVRLLCVADDGTNSTWTAYAASDVEPTLA